ncbi:MAG: aldehyde dehydrogenase family protein, partial [Bdellovibrionales bacterium]|nr:aldehyde dehydrogenase family protein [Bdellovibrionales bacterium]
MSSRFLNEKELKGFLKTADILLPGEGELPRFGQTDFSRYIDDILEEATATDVQDLKMLFGIFYWIPSFFIRIILVVSEKSDFGPRFWQLNMRLINIGLKGIIYSLYYSRLPDADKNGERIFNMIGWETKIPGLEKQENEMSLKDVRENARVAQEEIRKTSIKDRINFIKSLKNYVLDNKTYFVKKIHEETGKTRTDILTSEIFATIDFLNYLEKNAQKELKVRNVKTPIALMGKKSSVTLEPLGTMLIISPWNYPFFQALVPMAL